MATGHRRSAQRRAKHGTARGVLALLLAAAMALAAIGTAAAQTTTTKSKRAVLSIGLQQDMDSANTTVGELVASYETWNLQYATLTDKAASDFHNIPGLAESWKASNNGLTYTYTMRPNLKWSDGQPLTSDDVVYTINRARKEEWLNYTPTVNYLTATAKGPNTVVITTSVPDPKLPTMDLYILPKHIYSKISAKELPSYAATDGVGSGPFTLKQWKKGQFWTMDANPNYWQGKAAVDEVVFKVYNNADAMADALKNGELDGAENIPSGRYKDLSNTPNVVTVQGQQGGFDELAINSGDGVAGNPVLKDLRVRQAIAHAIDKQTLVSKVDNNLATAADAMSPSADPEWNVKLTDGERYDFDLKKANSILEAAGYKDTNGDGIREDPKTKKPLRLIYAQRSDSDVAKPLAQYITGWLRQIGIATTIKVYNDTQLTPVIGKGAVDLFVWGWTPFVDPDPELSYFQCDQIAPPGDPTNYYNDANWCNHTYDKLYKEQSKELDKTKRLDIVHQMLKLMYEQAPYVVLDYSPDLQAYRTDHFTGWIKQPANIGPVIFSNSSPSYFNLKPVGSSGSGGGLGTGALIAIIVGAVIVVGGGGVLLVRRRASAGERE